MTIPQKPYVFNPRSVTDAVDGGQTEPGSLLAATNLIFDPSNRNLMECRPAAEKVSQFAGLTSPEAVSIAYVVNDVCYGLISSSDVSGYDYPFAFDLVANVFYPVSGVKNSSTLPATQLTTNDWVPATSALVGELLIITHPGFPGGIGVYFGWFDITSPHAPVWNAGNTTTRALPSVPQAVAQFNNRAWFACGPAVNYTDALTLNISDATNVQTLTLQDTTPITALTGMPLTTSVQGILQSLVIFKADVIAYVTGDDTQGNLIVNVVSTGVGCNSPRSIAVTPLGLMFRASDGIRVLDLTGSLKEPNQDLKNPFIYTLLPSRTSAGYNNNIYRITTKNGETSSTPIEEYWYDFRRQGWTGPHTFIQTLAIPYDNTFVCFNDAIKPALFISDVVQSFGSIFIENGSALTFTEIATPLPDDGGTYESTAVLTVVDMQLPKNGAIYNFSASDASRGVLSSVIIQAPTVGSFWGAFTWGGGTWTGVTYGTDRYNIPWTQPLVFSRLVLEASGPSSLGFKIGKLTVGTQATNYVRILS